MCEWFLFINEENLKQVYKNLVFNIDHLHLLHTTLTILYKILNNRE